MIASELQILAAAAAEFSIFYLGIQKVLIAHKVNDSSAHGAAKVWLMIFGTENTDS